MAWAEGVGDIAVVFAALVGIADQQRNRRAGGDAFEHAREDLDLVFFLTLRDVARRARLAAVEFELDIGFDQRHARRAAVDHAADRGAVRLAEGRDGEKRTKRIAGHERRPKRCGESRYYASAQAPRATPGWRWPNGQTAAQPPHRCRRYFRAPRSSVTISCRPSGVASSGIDRLADRQRQPAHHALAGSAAASARRRRAKTRCPTGRAAPSARPAPACGAGSRVTPCRNGFMLAGLASACLPGKCTPVRPRRAPARNAS